MFRRQDPLTPINDTVEETEDLENVGDIGCSECRSGKRSEYEDIGMGVLVEGTENGTDHTNSNIVNNDPDFEELTLISNSVSEFINEGVPAESMTSMLFSCPMTTRRSHCTGG